MIKQNGKTLYYCNIADRAEDNDTFLIFGWFKDEPDSDDLIDLWNENNYEKIEKAYDYEVYPVVAENKNLKCLEEKDYKCVKDLQGGSFAVDWIGTLEEWQEKASDWARNDDWDDWKDVLSWSIDDIAEWWQIEIEEVKKNEN